MNPRGSDGKEWVDTLTWILADYDYVRVGTQKADWCLKGCSGGPDTNRHIRLVQGPGTEIGNRVDEMTNSKL